MSGTNACSQFLNSIVDTSRLDLSSPAQAIHTCLYGTDNNLELITQQLDNFKIIQFAVEELKAGEVNTAGEPVILLNINNNHAGT